MGSLGSSMKKDALLEATPLVQGTLLERREDIKSDLVRYFLSAGKISGEFEPDLIVSLSASNFDIQIDKSTVKSALDSFIDEGLVKHVSGDTYELVSRPEYERFESLIGPVWDEFIKYLDDSDSEIEPHNIDKEIQTAFYDYIHTFFEKLIDSSEDLTELASDPFLQEDFGSILDESIENNRVQKANAFRNALQNYWTDQSDKLVQLVNTIYSGIVNLDLLSREEYIDFNDVPATGKILVVDTNFLVSLLSETDRLNPLIKSICNRSNELGYDIFYIPDTVNEMQRVIDGSRHEMDGLRKTDRNTSVIESQFVSDFYKSKQTSWTNYLADLRNWQQYVEAAWGIRQIDYENLEVDGETTESAKDVLKQLEKIESRHRSRRKSPEVLDHDAHLLSYVATLRENQTGELNAGPFILSLDNSITSASEIGKGTFWEREIAMQPRNWLNYLLAFTPAEVDGNNGNDVAIALIESSTNFNDRMTIGEYSELIAPKIGLESGDERVLAEFLINSPLSRELEKALEKDQGGKAERLTRDALLDEEYLQNFSEQRDLKSKLENASETAREYERKYEHERERRKAAEEVAKSSNDIDISVSTSAIAESQAEAQAIMDLSVQVNNFIKTLDSSLDEGIEGSNIPNPPQETSNLQQVADWLQTVNQTLAAAEGLSAGATALQPFAQQLLEQANSLLV